MTHNIWFFSLIALLIHSAINLLRHWMAALRGAQHPHVRKCTLRCLRSVRLALQLLATISVAMYIYPPMAFSETACGSLDELDRTYKAAGNIEGEFTQTVHFADFDRQATSTGTVFFKNGHMRWDYRTPHAQQILITGDRILHYIPENQQVFKGPLQKRTGLPINLFSDLNKLTETFRISCRDKEVMLTPKKEGGSHMEKIILTLSPSLVKGAGLLIHKVILHETNQNRSTFLFHHFQINKSFRTDPFIFDIPKDVEVIETP